MEKGGSKLQRQRKSLGVTIREGRAKGLPGCSLYSLVFTCSSAREQRPRRSSLTLSPSAPRPPRWGQGQGAELCGAGRLGRVIEVAAKLSHGEARVSRVG